MILRIALPVPLDRLFDYLAPNNLAFPPRAGARVEVQFGRRQLIGLIVEIVAQSDYPHDKLKAVSAVLDQQPLVDQELIALGDWAARYYQYPLGDALINLIPNLARKQARPESKPALGYRVTPGALIEQISSRAVKQRSLFTLLQSAAGPVALDQLRDQGYEQRVIKALLEPGLIEATELSQQDPALGTQPITRSEPLRLNPQQQAALDAICSASAFRCFLIAGVTGSGKTEVYLQAIQRVLEQGRQALVLVPEIGLTPQLVARFQSRFHAPVVCLHSGLSDRMRFDAWQAARSGQAAVIIGTRSSIFVPLAKPGLILIDEEHDSSLKQQEGFRYHARDLALIRAQRLNIPVVLGSATPSLESLHNAYSGRYQLLELTERAGNALPPHFRLLDIRHQTLDTGLASETLVEIGKHLSRGNQALVFINRRGFSPSLICQQCGTPVDCSRCDAHMTLHRSPARLHCHHCDRQTPIPRGCAQCGSTELRPSGSGTERIEDRLCELFPDTPVMRVDRDSTGSRSAFEKLMSEVNRGEPCILVGTQMLAKGHHFPSVTLVCIVNADAGLFSADFRGLEHMAQLTLQVAGRAGRADKPGEVIMQTMNADHPMLGSLIDQGYMQFASQELRNRAAAGLPPFSYQALIRGEASRQGWAEAYLLRVKNELFRAGLINAESFASGPFPAQMEKRAGVFRAQLLLSSSKRARLQQLLHYLRSLIAADSESNRIRFSIDVDPIDSY